MGWRYGSLFGWTLYQPSPITDAATGILGAFATAVALYRRFDTGVGQQVGSSLVQASTLQQGVTIIDETRAGGEWTAGHGEYGLSAFYRLYRGSDRSFFLVVRDEDGPPWPRSSTSTPRGHCGTPPAIRTAPWPGPSASASPPARPMSGWPS